ncbi:hypothetical protein HMPREF9554_00380 [Treponema phagedenis F0421]|nr:hypothetical protein HMPREF9554_00380 [Treponema phagedenis F0421]
MYDALKHRFELTRVSNLTIEASLLGSSFFFTFTHSFRIL